MSRIVVIDTETTGLSPLDGDRVIEIGAVEIVNGKLTGKNFQSYVNPEGKQSGKDAYNIHKLKPMFLARQNNFSEIAHDFLDFISGAEHSYYNRNFDQNFIQSELDKAGFDVVLSNDYISSCLMRDYARIYNNGRDAKLDNACRKFKIDISKREVHGALIDAKLAAELYVLVHSSQQTVASSQSARKKQAPPVATPIPRAYKHPKTDKMIQLNYCKNPDCDNYGIPAKNPTKNKNGKPNRGLPNDYKLTKTNKGSSLTCKLCNTSTFLINNKSFVEESERVTKRVEFVTASCPNDQARKRGRVITPCINFDKDIHLHPLKYAKKGIKRSTVKRGKKFTSQRFECKACNTRFYVPMNPQLGQKRHDINPIIFKLLTNKGIINRIQEICDVSIPLIYDRIEFFYNQCIQFEQKHISNNLDNLKGQTLNVSMDRQHYLANWNDRGDCRPTKLVNTSSADNSSGYVFASTLNFDFKSDWESIRKESLKQQDSGKPVYKRRYSQYIIKDSDVETDDTDDSLSFKAPAKHLLVQQTYSLMAHLECMKLYYDKAKHINLFADDDEGFELGISLVLREQISQGKIYPVMIQADRNNSSQMQDRHTRSEQILQDGGLSLNEIKNARSNPEEERKLNQKYWSSVIQQHNEDSGTTKSEWLIHPFSKANEKIRVKPLIGFNPDITLTVADTLLEATTYGVDNYFQSIRRRINMLERPITSATNGQRWNGYAAYNPKWVTMLIEIFRVYKNYVLTDEKTIKNKKLGYDPTTPAQKIGFAQKKYKTEDIINFSILAEHAHSK